VSAKPVDKEDRKKSILAAAATVFAKHGYQRTTVDQIADAAGVAKGSIYLYFHSKEDLFHALFESFAKEAGIPADPDDHSADLGRSGLDGVQRLLLGIASAIDRDESIIPLTLEFWSVCGVDATRERFGQIYTEMLADLRSKIVRRLDDAKALGEIETDVPTHAVASCMIAMIDGLLIQQWIVPGVKASSVLQQSLPVLLRNLRPPEDRERTS
jgi:AcrR family transcriptional regulator